jgi:hypothetical protein
MFMMVTTTLMAPRIEEAPIMCTEKISMGKEAPFCGTSGGYMVNTPAVPRLAEQRGQQQREGKRQDPEAELFSRGSAIRAPLHPDHQLASPVRAGITAPKIMMSACIMV